MSLIGAWRDLSMHPVVLPFTRRRISAQWRNAGCPVPPPHVVKQQHLLEYQRRGGYRTFVETGTHTGEMVAAMHRYFDRVVSIELLPRLYEAARERFAGTPNVELLLGDSAAVLPTVLASINAPSLFWLDGHSTGNAAPDQTPLLLELEAVLRHPISGHAVLIDDARLFTGSDGYPVLDDLIARIHAARPGSDVCVEMDAICCILEHG